MRGSSAFLTTYRQQCFALWPFKTLQMIKGTRFGHMALYSQNRWADQITAATPRLTLSPPLPEHIDPPN